MNDPSSLRDVNSPTSSANSSELRSVNSKNLFDPLDPTDLQCEAVTIKKTRCKRERRSYGKFCRQHVKKRYGFLISKDANVINLSYYENLNTFYFDEEKLIQGFPPNVKDIIFSNSDIHRLPSLPDGLTYLDCSNTEIEDLLKLPPNLKDLNCSNTQIEELPELPSSLEVLDISFTRVKWISEFPPNLRVITLGIPYDFLVRWLPRPSKNLKHILYGNGIINYIDLWKSIYEFYDKRLATKVLRTWRTFVRKRMSNKSSLSKITLDLLLYETGGVEYRKTKKDFNDLKFS